MIMNTALRTGLLASAFAIGLAGCATTSGGLASSAERLERASYAFQRDADEGREGRGYERDARSLAEEAKDFRMTLSDRRADDRDVRDAFQDLSRSYHAARDEVERNRSRDSGREFAAVTEAYLDVERAMNSSDPRRDRYAGDERDRYRR
jgi:hypothetical protein